MVEGIFAAKPFMVVFISPYDDLGVAIGTNFIYIYDSCCFICWLWFGLCCCCFSN